MMEYPTPVERVERFTAFESITLIVIPGAVTLSVFMTAVVVFAIICPKLILEIVV